MQSLGYGSLAVGLSLALFHATRIVAPNVWAALAHYHNISLISLVRFGCLAACFCILGLFFEQGPWALAIILCGFGFFWSAVLPPFEVITLQHLKSEPTQYGKIRLWGGIGFLCVVLGFGKWFDWFGLALFPQMLLLVLVALWISALMVRAPTAVSEFAPGSRRFSDLVKRTQVLLFLAIVLLVQISFGPYYSFFSIYLDDFGFTSASIGFYWSLGVAAEIFIFTRMHALFRRFSMRTLLIATLVLTTCRWILIWGFIPNLLALVLAQLLHAFAFGSFHACMIEQVRRLFAGRQHARGQALFNSLGYGLGAVLGATISGLLWQPMGRHLFLIAAALSLVALVLTLFFVEQEASGKDPV